MGERTEEIGSIDQPEEALERPVVAPGSGLLSWLHSVRGTLGALMVGAAASLPYTESYGAEKLDTAVEAKARTIEIAIIKYHPKDSQRPMMAKLRSGATVNIQLISPTNAKKKGQYLYDPVTKEITFYHYDGRKINVSVVDESQLTKPLYGQDLRWQEERAAKFAQIIKAPTEQLAPAIPLEEAPLEDVIPDDQVVVQSKIYPAQRVGYEYSCDVPAITVAENGKDVRAPSTIVPHEWTVEPRTIQYDLLVQAKGNFTFSYLLPLPPDIGNQKRLLTELDVSVGEVLKSKRSFVTDIVITPGDASRQAFVRLTMTGFSAVARDIPLNVRMHSWMAMPKYQHIDQHALNDANVQKAMRLLQPHTKKPQPDMMYPGMVAGEYHMAFPSDKNSKQLAEQRRDDVGAGYIVMAWNNELKRLKHLYVTPGHVVCNTGTYAVHDQSFVPLSLASYGALPKIEGLNPDFAAEAGPLNVFAAVKGDMHYGPHLLEGKISMPAPLDAEVPAWVQAKAKEVAAARTVINKNGKDEIAAADKAVVPQD